MGSRRLARAEDLGEQLVKNIAHPIRAFRLRIGEDTSAPRVSDNEEIADSPEPPSPVAISELSADNEVALELAFWESSRTAVLPKLEQLS